jgi:hypothetical protein
MLKAVLRIRTFWSGSSAPLTSGSRSGSGPYYYRQDGKKTIFFCLLLFEPTFTSFFKDKRKKEVTKQ